MAVLYAVICMRSSAPSRGCAEIDLPKTIRVDQGSEFVSRDRDLRAYLNGVTLGFSRPGKPTDNASVEAFNGEVRHEFLSATCSFRLRAPAKRSRLGAGSTTRTDPTARSGTTSRYRSLTAGAPPACRRNEAGIFQTRAAQGSGTALQQ